MISATALDSDVREAYDAIASAYDVLTARYAYDRWLLAIEDLAVSHGLRGQRLLDVACGTGKSFLPLRARGYKVTGCDISTGMLRCARRKAPDVPLYEADMRELPVFGRFDLITCLDDALNYVLEEGQLETALSGIASNLADDGIAVWDLNTLAQYRGQFAHDEIVAHEDVFIGWRGGQSDREPLPEALVEIAIDVFTHAGEGRWRRSTSVHRQHHWSCATIERLAASAGMQVLEVRGQSPGAVIDDHLDEGVHTKTIFVARRKEAAP